MNMKGNRIACSAAAALLLLRLLAPAQTERLRELLLGRAGRQAVQAVCVSFAEADDDTVLSVFREDAP